MPYYLFAVAADREPASLASAETYREAKAALTALRDAAARSQSLPEGAFVRMVFSADEAAAVELLTRPREPDPSLDAEDD